ncbi:hypothetical protein CZ787_01340 [Halomonas citrativorans]|uniref:Uncharacterized protein n=1 Tax=Halomonas citrativorans TaxID=2742612 RepID=A0A1R4HPA4_9GAMM|nr:hypothetical protein CZ787_01340 [Halomonas citrativorans]
MHDAWRGYKCLHGLSDAACGGGAIAISGYTPNTGVESIASPFWQYGFLRTC